MYPMLWRSMHLLAASVMAAFLSPRVLHDIQPAREIAATMWRGAKRIRAWDVPGEGRRHQSQAPETTLDKGAPAPEVFRIKR